MSLGITPRTRAFDYSAHTLHLLSINSYVACVMNKALRILLVLLTVACFDSRVFAVTGQAFQSLPAIQAAVETYVTASAQSNRETKLTIGRLDPRLRLAACDIPLLASQNPGSRRSGATSVNVRCEGSAPWSIFVPALIREKHLVVVATHTLAAGHLLRQEDVTTQAVWMGDAATHYLEDIALAVGKQTRRMIAAGMPLPLQGLRSPRAVRRGATITVALARGPLAVRVGGVALQDGAVGDRIQARNHSSRRIVEGVIGDDGVLMVR